MTKFIAFIILAVSAAGLAAQTNPPADRSMPNGLGMGLFNKRVDVSSLPENLQTMITDFRAQRASFLEQRRAMFDELKDLTEDERKARIQELRAQTREALMAQRELAKNIREELRRLRDERRNDSGG
jgi:thermostable 8-oxoguanine DNA glycosylase